MNHQAWAPRITKQTAQCQNAENGFNLDTLSLQNLHKNCIELYQTIQLTKYVGHSKIMNRIFWAKQGRTILGLSGL